MQEGRILFYNSQSGHGKLILKSGEKIDFSVDIWEDFESIPETGILVECSIEDGTLKSLKAIPLNIPIAQNDFEGSTVLAPFDDEKGSTFGVVQTLQNYFSSVDFLIGEPPDIVNTKEQLDYFLSRRFLITAYNNLKSLDPSLHDHAEIKEKLKVLEHLHKAYYNVSERADVPLLAFEMIFLRSQPEYMQFIQNKDMYLNRISVLTTVSESLFPEIQKKEAELKKLAKDEKARIKLEDKLKPLRGNYVDAIHEKAALIEELTAMKDVKDIYTKKYFNSFVSELSKLSGQYQEMLSKILNYKAYELDKMIWEHAGRSKRIQEYFRYAGIKGDYSTMTFLSYYLKTLDKEQLGEEQVELFKFLKYLEKIQKV